MALAQELEVSTPKKGDARGLILSVVKDVLEEVKPSTQDKSWRGHQIALKYFCESRDKQYVEDLGALTCCDRLHFARKKKQTPCIVHNKFASSLCFWTGMDC